MPFKSDAQRKFLEIHHPEIAKEFAAHTPSNEKLPEHVSDNMTPERKLAAMKAAIATQN